MNWKAPDTLVLPVVHGILFLGAHLGFKELKEAGLIKRVPKFVGIQSAACAPLALAFQKKTGGILTVREEEIDKAARAMGRRGHFIEPTIAATTTGLKKYLRKKGRRESVISTLAGLGLKSIGKVL